MRRYIGVYKVRGERYSKRQRQRQRERGIYTYMYIYICIYVNYVCNIKLSTPVQDLHGSRGLGPRVYSEFPEPSWIQRAAQLL